MTFKVEFTPEAVVDVDRLFDFLMLCDKSVKEAFNEFF